MPIVAASIIFETKIPMKRIPIRNCFEEMKLEPGFFTRFHHTRSIFYSRTNNEVHLSMCAQLKSLIALH